MNWQKLERVSQKINERILRQIETYLEKLLCLCSVFFFQKDQRRKDGNDFEKDTVLGFQNTPALHLRAKTYSALSFDLFQHGEFVFSFSETLCCVLLFREPIKSFFLDACQMIVKSCVLHLFPVPQTGRSHIINILLASFFRSVL